MLEGRNNCACLQYWLLPVRGFLKSRGAVATPRQAFPSAVIGRIRMRGLFALLPTCNRSTRYPFAPPLLHWLHLRLCTRCGRVISVVSAEWLVIDNLVYTCIYLYILGGGRHPCTITNHFPHGIISGSAKQKRSDLSRGPPDWSRPKPVSNPPCKQ